MSIFDVLKLLLNVLGGLAIFLYGLRVMSKTLQKISTEKLKTFFDKLTSNRFKGVLFGGIVTSILQSSSATTVLMIGFANAGIIGLTQCISIIFGANIGTTVTAQIIAFKYSQIALPIIGVGGVMTLLSKNKKWQSIGEVVLGLGLLFYGLKILGSFLKPLNEIAVFQNMLAEFGQVPILGLVVGMIVTVIFQSSSATTGLIIILAGLGLIDFKAAFSLELGCNIGTTITAQIAAIGTNITAKRAAWAHSLFNVIGSMYMLILLYITYEGRPVFLYFIDSITPGDVWAGQNIERHIANAHTFFNIFNVLVLIPFIAVLAKITVRIIPGKPNSDLKSKSFLDKRMVNSPPIALQQVFKETVRMGFLTKEMALSTYNAVLKENVASHDDVLEFEEILNTLETQIMNFVIDIDHDLLTQKEVLESNSLLQLVRHFERIGDNLIAISLFSSNLNPKFNIGHESHVYLKNMFKNIHNSLDTLLVAIDDPEFKCKLARVQDYVEENARFEDDYRNHEIDRIKRKEISPEEGIFVLDTSARLDQVSKYIIKVCKQLHLLLDE